MKAPCLSRDVRYNLICNKITVTEYIVYGLSIIYFNIVPIDQF